jgi:tetratricopeptide (TPR) repeat protein
LAWREALDGFVDESRRLGRAIKDVRSPHDHHAAAQLLERGRRAFNEKDLKRAEDYFRRALIEDPHYALAHTYLGVVLYKQERLREAILCWNKAVELDPGSDAAHRAERHLKGIRLRKRDVITSLEEDLG